MWDFQWAPATEKGRHAWWTIRRMFILSKGSGNIHWIWGQYHTVRTEFPTWQLENPERMDRSGCSAIIDYRTVGYVMTCHTFPHPKWYWGCFHLFLSLSLAEWIFKVEQFKRTQECETAGTTRMTRCRKKSRKYVLETWNAKGLAAWSEKSFQIILTGAVGWPTGVPPGGSNGILIARTLCGDPEIGNLGRRIGDWTENPGKQVG